MPKYKGTRYNWQGNYNLQIYQALSVGSYYTLLVVKSMGVLLASMRAEKANTYSGQNTISPSADIQ